MTSTSRDQPAEDSYRVFEGRFLPEVGKVVLVTSYSMQERSGASSRLKEEAEAYAFFTKDQSTLLAKKVNYSCHRDLREALQGIIGPEDLLAAAREIGEGEIDAFLSEREGADDSVVLPAPMNLEQVGDRLIVRLALSGKCHQHLRAIQGSTSNNDLRIKIRDVFQVIDRDDSDNGLVQDIDI